MPLVIFGVSAFISGLLILMLPETLGKELPANIREALDLALPAPSERPFGPERLAVPIGMVTSFFYIYIQNLYTTQVNSLQKYISSSGNNGRYIAKEDSNWENVCKK